MKLLIIGGSGFVSGHVLDAAIKAGPPVPSITLQQGLKEQAEYLIGIGR